MASMDNPWLDPSVIVLGAQDAIIGQRLDGAIVIWNTGAERLFGYRAAEMLGQSAEMLAAGSGSPPFSDVLERVGEGVLIPPYEEELRRKDGEVVLVSVAISPVFEEGERLWGISRIIRPVSAWPAEMGYGRAGDRGRALDRDMRQLSRLTAMGQIVVALAHELSQPLTATGLYLSAAQQLLRGQWPEERENRDMRLLPVAVERAAEQADRAAKIIRRLRAFVSQDENERVQVLIGETILEAGELALIAARQAGVLVEFRLEEDAAVLIDRVQIQQVLFSLMHNAVEAMAGTSSSILRISTARIGEDIVVSIAGAGPGLAQAAVERLFRPFVATKPDGIDGGLSLSRAIIAAHGGELWFAPEVSRGAVLQFKLPVAGTEA